MRRVLTAIAVGLAALLGVALAPSAAIADSPFSVTDVVTDRTGDISSTKVGDVRQAIKVLEQETGVTLYVVVVDTFENPSNGFDWATKVAETSRLTDQDVILYIGMQARDFGLNAASSLDLSDATLRDIETKQIKPQLDSGNVAQAAINAADALRGALTGTSAGLPGPAGSGGSSGTSTTSSSTAGSSAAGPIALGVVSLGVVGLVGASAMMGGRKRKRAREEQQALEVRKKQELAALSTQASQSLVQLDDTIGSAEQELGFASAEFGDEPIAAFRTAIESAKGKSKEAFGLQAQLLDHIPDTPEQQWDWNQQILRLTGEATQGIKTAGADFDRLRALSKDVPQTLTQITAAAEQAGPRIDAAERTVASLSSTYSAEAVRTIADAPKQARDRLAFAVDRAQDGAKASSAGRSGEAAVYARDAQTALAQIDQLLGGVDQAQKDLAGAPEMVRAEISDMEQDLARLEAADAQSSADAVARARAAIQQAQAPEALTRDPLAALASLREANRQLDGAVKAVVDAEQRLGQIRQRLERSLAQARSQVQSGLSYMTANRGGVGANARARLTQAESELATAEQLAQSDPEQALAHADQAVTIATRALQLAQSDVDSATSMVQQGGYGAGYRSPYGGYYGGSSSGLGDAIIGGIIGGMLTGGGSSRRGGGYGGGFGGGFGGGGFSSSGGFRSGGFGGGFGSSGGGRRR